MRPFRGLVLTPNSLLMLAVGRCKLEAILVLRIQDGNDIFLAASGAYAPSFFGLSLGTLADLPRCERTACVSAHVTPRTSSCCAASAQRRKTGSAWAGVAAS